MFGYSNGRSIVFGPDRAGHTENRARVIKIQILLRKEWRNPRGVDLVKEAATALGMTPTAAGLATLSAEMEPAAFTALFGQPVRQLPPKPPGAADFGGSAGAVSGLLPVPETLRAYVEGIAVAPPHLLF